MLPAALNALVATFYATVTDRRGWQRLVEDTAAASPGYGVILRIRRGGPGVDQLLHAGYAPGAIEDFVANHASLCPWNDIERDSQVGAAYATEDVMPLESISYSRFYRNWIVPNGLGAGFGVKICDYPDCSASLTLDCPPERGKTGKSATLSFLHEIAPHLQRVVEISRHLEETRVEGLCAGVTRSSDATAVLDDNGVVVTMNDAMEGLVSQGFCSLSSGRRLRLHRSEDTARLMSIVQDATGNGPSLSWPQYIAFDVPRESGPNVLGIEPLGVLGAKSATNAVTPFMGQAARPYFAVTLRVRSRMRGPSVEDIRIGLGLTPKQAEAVWSLVHGESIDKQAQDRGLSVDGVRWHFKNIYQRTGCSNQAELVRLVVSLFGRPSS
jgi:DNA-binding CsgD family transcriptional regulator